MGISREIGWGQNDILLYEIAKKLEQLTKVVSNATTVTTTTTTSP